MMIVIGTSSLVEGRTAVCFIDGNFALKRLHITATGVELLPANPDYNAIPVEPEIQFPVWGIVSLGGSQQLLLELRRV